MPSRAVYISILAPGFTGLLRNLAVPSLRPRLDRVLMDTEGLGDGLDRHPCTAERLGYLHLHRPFILHPVRGRWIDS